MFNFNKIKKSILAVVIAGVLLVPISASAIIKPFGGIITSIKPCLKPPGLLIKMSGGETLLYMFGISFSFIFGPPVHPGQGLLGLSGKGVSCFTKHKKGKWKKKRSGGLILFHGSSL